MISEPNQSQQQIVEILKPSESSIKSISLPGSKMNNFNITSSQVERSMERSPRPNHEASRDNRQGHLEAKPQPPQSKSKPPSTTKALKAKGEKSKHISKKDVFSEKHRKHGSNQTIRKVSPVEKQNSVAQSVQSLSQLVLTERPSNTRQSSRLREKKVKHVN